MKVNTLLLENILEKSTLKNILTEDSFGDLTNQEKEDLKFYEQSLQDQRSLEVDYRNSLDVLQKFVDEINKIHADREKAKKSFSGAVKELQNPLGSSIAKSLKDKFQYNTTLVKYENGKVLPSQRYLFKKRDIEDNIEKAKKRLGDTSIDLDHYEYISSLRKPKGVSKVKTKEEELDTRPKFRFTQNVEDVPKNVWNSWNDFPKFLDYVRKNGIDFKSSAVGEGPGEQWLSVLFDAKIAGASTSYDLVLDNKTWEVKSLEGAPLVRPGTEGLRAYAKTGATLAIIMKQLKNFVTMMKKIADLNGKINSRLHNAYVWLADDIDQAYETFIEKGEISKKKFAWIRKAIFVGFWFISAYKEAEKDINTTITLNSKSVNLPKHTYVDLARKIEKISNVEILTGYQEIDIAVSTLKHKAFEQPDTFLKEWFNSVDTDIMFSQVSGGIILVKADSFMVIPKNKIKEMLKFVSVSQGKPKLALAGYSSEDDE